MACGEALGKADRRAESEAQLKRVTELAPQDAFARTRAGSALARQGTDEEAAAPFLDYRAAAYEQTASQPPAPVK